MTDYAYKDTWVYSMEMVGISSSQTYFIMYSWGIIV